MYKHIYIYIHIYNIHANCGVKSTCIYKNVYNIHTYCSAMWMPYWDKQMCMCDILLT